MYLLNAFSLSMLADLAPGLPSSVSVTQLSVGYASHLLEQHGFQSAVGHADTAAIFASLLDVPVPCNRTTVQLASGDQAIVGQYVGPRLPEGATTLPEGASIKWMLVEVA